MEPARETLYLCPGGHNSSDSRDGVFACLAISGEQRQGDEYLTCWEILVCIKSCGNNKEVWKTLNITSQLFKWTDMHVNQHRQLQNFTWFQSYIAWVGSFVKFGTRGLILVMGRFISLWNFWMKFWTRFNHYLITITYYFIWRSYCSWKHS